MQISINLIGTGRRKRQVIRLSLDKRSSISKAIASLLDWLTLKSFPSSTQPLFTLTPRSLKAPSQDATEEKERMSMMLLLSLAVVLLKLPVVCSRKLTKFCRLPKPVKSIKLSLWDLTLSPLFFRLQSHVEQTLDQLKAATLELLLWAKRKPLKKTSYFFCWISCNSFCCGFNLLLGSGKSTDTCCCWSSHWCFRFQTNILSLSSCQSIHLSIHPFVYHS